MNIKIRICFKKRRFLALKPPFIADKTVLFNVKNHTFLREKQGMKLVFALSGYRRHGFMPCRLSKSFFLVFYFVKNRDDDFSLL